MYILLVPWLFVGFLCIGLLLILRRRIVIGCLMLAAAVSLNEWAEVWSYGTVRQAFANSPGAPAASTTGQLRLLVYNIPASGAYIAQGGDSLTALLHTIDSIQADIAYFPQNWSRAFRDSMSLRYPYTNISHFLTRWWQTSDNTVFSRYPIASVKRIGIDDPELTQRTQEWLGAAIDTAKQADIQRIVIHRDGRELVLYACHLMSNRYSLLYDSLRHEHRSAIAAMRTFMTLISQGYQIRARQADLIRQHIDGDTGLPVVVAGDLNDLSGSYALRTIAGTGLRNAWWQGGMGFGFTYADYHLFLRLDHVLYAPCHFRLVSTHVLDGYPYSDHRPLVVDLAPI